MRPVRGRPFRADRPCDRGPRPRRGAPPPAVPLPSDDVDGRVGERVGLLLHVEDLAPESLLAEHPSLAPLIRAAAVAADPGQRSPAEVSPAVAALTAGAVADAVSRTTGATVLDSVEPSAVLDWAGAADLDTVVVPYAPIGPVRERLELLRTSLGAEAVALVTVRRRWDGRAWPHASRGFFPFRERIPGLVRGR